MKVSKLLIIALLISVLMLSSPVFAETLTGTLGGTGTITDNYNYPWNAVTLSPPTSISVTNIEITQGVVALVRFDNGMRPTYFSATPTGDVATFTAKIGTDLIGTGSFGYQRNFQAAWPYSEIDGYQFLDFSSWNPGTYTGNQIVNLTISGGINGLNWTNFVGGLGAPPEGRLYFGVGVDGALPTATGIYILNRASTFHATYTVTKPAGIGISGSVDKLGTVGRIFVFNGTSETILVSDSTFNSNNSNINVPVQTIRISAMDTFLNWYNTSALFTVPTPTPTPTPSPGGGYSITVVPSTIPMTSSTVGTIIGSNIGKINDITWWGNDATGGVYYFYEAGNTSRPLGYNNQSGTWYGFDPGTSSYTNLKGTIPNPITISNISSGGITTITCFIGTSDGNWYALTTPITIQQAGGQTLTIQAKDFDTGSLVGYTDISVQNVATGAWTNATASSGSYNFVYPYATQLYIEAVATGYAKSTKTWSTTHTPTDTLWLIMYRGVTPPAANVTLQVAVYDNFNLAPIPGALVHVFQMLGTGGESKLTSSAGSTSFNTSENTVYTIAVTKYGYQNGGMSVDTGPGGNIIDEVIMLNRATAPTPTVTVPTAVPSGLPTTSPVGPAGNYTGFWGPMYSMFGAMGADVLTMQLLMACFFVFCGVVVGGFGMGTIIPGAPFSGTGAEAGGVFAFVMACAFGFISILWIVVIFVWIAFRYFLHNR
jgi:hypothetical protein